MTVLGLALWVSGCGAFPTAGRFGARGPRLATIEEQEVMADAYLTALRDGDLEAAADMICDQDPASRGEFIAHHRSGLPRPVSWEVMERRSGSNGLRGGGYGGHASPWPRYAVRFDDGLEVEVGIGEANGGLCYVAASDEHKEGIRRLAVEP